MPDFETLECKKTNTEQPNEDELTDFPSICIDLTKKINFKVAFFLLIVGFFLFSDVFVNTFLCKFKNTVIGDCPTSVGSSIQLIIFVLLYLVIDLLVQGKIL